MKANNKPGKESDWDNKLGSRGELSGEKGCGEYRFIPIKNILEFILTTNCEVKVGPKDSIASSVRLAWTLNEFYADGGVVSFADRVASALGVPAYSIKVVAVYQGSVIVDYEILP